MLIEGKLGRKKVSRMRVEIVAEAEGTSPGSVFPPGEKYLDLRANPQSVDQIGSARQYLPLRNFLNSVNSAESVFATASATTKSDLPATVSADLAHEFASQTRIVFAEPSFNWEQKHYTDLCSALEDLLERDTADAARAVLKISSCDFTAEKRCGFCLDIRLVIEGESPQQAEVRWGLGLARIQQALLFCPRALKQKIPE
jgi:hypothetical protein